MKKASYEGYKELASGSIELDKVGVLYNARSTFDKAAMKELKAYLPEGQ